MKFILHLNAHLLEDRVEIYAKEKTEIITQIEQLISSNDEDYFIGSCRDEIRKIYPNEVICFSVESGKLYAYLSQQKYRLKQRLYEVEQIVGISFLKIHQSCLVNINFIEKFKVSWKGELMVVLNNGKEEYVSRRRLKDVKERLGL